MPTVKELTDYGVFMFVLGFIVGILIGAVGMWYILLEPAMRH